MTVFWREAVAEDVPAIVAMLADDLLGRSRECDDLSPYRAAFEAMQAESGNCLIVGEVAGTVVATYQLTFITGLSLKAARRAQLESVRVASEQRGGGIGAALMRDAEERARAANCSLIQFTSNATRDRAHEFYKRQGYLPSHLGFKKVLG